MRSGLILRCVWELELTVFYDWLDVWEWDRGNHTLTVASGAFIAWYGDNYWNRDSPKGSSSLGWASEETNWLEIPIWQSLAYGRCLQNEWRWLRRGVQSESRSWLGNPSPRPCKETHHPGIENTKFILVTCFLFVIAV